MTSKRNLLIQLLRSDQKIPPRGGREHEVSLDLSAGGQKGHGDKHVGLTAEPGQNLRWTPVQQQKPRRWQTLASFVLMDLIVY